MIETFAVPVLLKAVEFLFGEGSKILQERRERRLASQKDNPGEAAVVPSQPVPPAPDLITSRESALSQRIAEEAWNDSRANIEHLLALLEIHTKNYNLAKQQYAKWGSALVPPIIVHNLAEAEDQIAVTTRELQAALSRIYGKRVAAPEVEQA